MRKKLLYLFIALLFVSVRAIAQQKGVSGKIRSQDQGNALQGVSIKIKGTSFGTMSDVNGSYFIQASKGQVLVFTYVGFLPQEMSVGTNRVINIKLVANTQSLNELVVVGYGTQKRANLTGAVTTVDTKVLKSRPITDVARGLQGVVPGLTITTATGDIGTDPKIRLRGLIGSINSGAAGAAPLILVDNVEIPSLQLVNPDDVESVSILKDAASSSIYGTRAAFGVILITTKTGKRNAPGRISYSNNFAWSSPLSTPKLASAVDNSQASLLALQRFNPNTTSYSLIGYSIDSASIAKTGAWQQQYGNQNLSPEMVKGRDFDIIGGKLYFYRSWDPAKLFLRDPTPQQTHNLSISGGSEKINYNIGLAYLNQAGVLKVNPDQFKRYNFSLNVNASPNAWLDVRAKIIYSNTLSASPYSFYPSQYGPFYYLYRWPANYPYGTYKGLPFRSNITEDQQAKLDQDQNNLSRISVGATLKLMKDLTLDADYTYSASNKHLHQTGNNTEAYNFWSFDGTDLDYGPYQDPSNSRAIYYSYWNEVNTGKLFATYTKNMRDHSFKAILGGDIELNKSTSQTSERRNLLDPNFGELSLASGDQFVSGTDGHFSTLGFFARINYAFKEKFLIEVNSRVDGSSRFPSNRLYGFFPSASAGYVLTQESFMDWSKNFLSFLKVRSSYGSVGNQAVGDNRFLSVLSAQSSGWILPTGNALTVTTPGARSPSLTWETVTTADLGLEARFFKDAFGVSADIYRRTTSNMITQGVTLPSSFGTTSPVRNYGELRGDGWELSLNYNHSFANGFHFNLNGTLSNAIETISKFPNTTRALPAPIAEVNKSYYTGMKFGEIWGYQTDRLFTTSDFSARDATGHYIYAKGVASQSQLESGSFYFGPGDVKYKDLNGDGVIYSGTNTVDNPGDKKIIGNSTPRYQYGLRLSADWKGFDLSAFLQGVGKRELWADGSLFVPGYRAAEAWYANQLDYWTPQNPNAFYPRPTNYGGTGDKWDFLPQTRYLLNMAYLRLKNLNVGYSFSTTLLKKVKIEKFRIYLSGENLLTFDHLGKIPIDPETDFTQSQLEKGTAGFGRVYPYRKTFSFGVQITL